MSQFERLPHLSTLDPYNPWKPDHLNRKTIADQLTKLITNLNQPYVLSLTSPWGTGKTEFLRRWKADLESQGYSCIHFDAWSNDFSEDPFFAFMGEIKNYVDNISRNNSTTTENTKKKIQHTLKKLIKFGEHFIEKSPKYLTYFIIYQGIKHGFDFASMTEELRAEEAKHTSPQSSNLLDDAAKTIANITAEAVSSYQKEQKAREEFRVALTEFSQSLVEHVGKKAPLIILVDELDRCRPNYALELLEKIKHLFYTKDVVFILAVDKAQLCNTITSVYGPGINSEVYLRKFIDIEFRLPTPSNSNFFDYLTEKFNLKELTQQPDSNQQFFSELRELFVSLSKAFSLSLRDQSQIMTRLSISYKVYDESPMLKKVIATMLLLSFDQHRIDKLFLDPTYKNQLALKYNRETGSYLNFETYLKEKCNSLCISEECMLFLSTTFEYLSSSKKKRRDLYNNAPISVSNNIPKIERLKADIIFNLYTNEITPEQIQEIINMTESFNIV